MATSIPSLVGGTQRVNLSYELTGRKSTDLLNNMSLVMKILPTVDWEPLGKPPPEELEFVAAFPQPQDVQFRLDYGAKMVMAVSFAYCMHFKGHFLHSLFFKEAIIVLTNQHFHAQRVKAERNWTL